MKIYAIKTNETRSGYRFCTRNAMLKMMAYATWQLRLTESDNTTINPDSHIYCESNDANKILDEIERNNGWGVWGVIEVKQPTGTILDNIFSDPRQYLVSLEEVTE